MGKRSVRIAATNYAVLLVLGVFTAIACGQESPSQFGDYAYEAAASSSVRQDVGDAVWKLIDANGDGRATDREAYAAIRDVRKLANAGDESDLHAAVRKAANTDDVLLVNKAEALGLIAVVRGERCPTAKAAKTYFDTLDSSDNGTLEPAEMQTALAPLGKVGLALFQPVGITVKSMDLNGNNVIETDELYLSANAMMRVKLAIDGEGIAQRNPNDWLKFVSAVAYMDVNADNVVSPSEATQIASIGSQFKKIDANGDSQVTIVEICEYQAELDLRAYLAQSVGGS